MQKLLNFREKVKAFVDKNNVILRYIFKFIIACIMMQTLNRLFGYAPFLQQKSLAMGVAAVCVFIPFSYSSIVFAFLVSLNLIYVSIDVTILFVLIFLLVYLIYNRSLTKYGYVAIMTAILLPTKLSALIPIFVGIFIGGMGLPPMLFGILTYVFAITLDKGIIDMAKNVGSQQLYQIVIEGMMNNSQLLLYLLSFLLTALIAGKIYRMKISYAWHIAIAVAGAIHAAMYLYGCFLLEVQSSTIGSILTAVISIAVLEVIQFFKCILDYSQVENLEYEDDEYYYYVKAVPKIKVAVKDVDIKRITERRTRFIRRKEKKE